MDLNMSAEQAAGVYLLSLIGAMGLILLGIFAVIVYRHLIRVILGLSILEAGVNLFLITLSFRPNAVAPIIGAEVANMVDPLPQALVLTAIVIGVSVQALLLSLAIKVYQAHNTLDTRILAEKIAAESGTIIVNGIPVHVPTPKPKDTLAIEGPNS